MGIKEGYCDRCGAEGVKLFSYDYVDDYGEKKHKDICWDCDFETMNGKDIDDDIGDVLAEREERRGSVIN